MPREGNKGGLRRSRRELRSARRVAFEVSAALGAFLAGVVGDRGPEAQDAGSRMLAPWETIR